MYWTLDLASKLEDAPWPATKDELIDYAGLITQQKMTFCGMRMNTNGQIDYCLAYEAVPLWDGFCV